MNKPVIVKMNFVIVALSVLVCFSMTGNVYPISSADEFLSHTKGSDTCLTDKCHSGMTKNKQFLHEPVAKGQCSSCHKAESYPDKLGIKSRNHICSECHKKMEDEVMSRRFIHGPVKTGDCLSCHDPHASENRFYLKDSEEKICFTCHLEAAEELKKKYTHEQDT